MRRYDCRTRSGKIRKIIAVSLVNAICISVIGLKPATAQTAGSFQVVGDTSPLEFSVNKTNISSATGANLNPYLSLRPGNKNIITVGWNPLQQGSYIEMQYTGTGSYSLGSTPLTTGDYLHIYAIGGVDLVNGFSIDGTQNGNSLTYWNSTTASTEWSKTSGENYVGYSSGWSADNSFLAYNDSGTGVDGKSFANAAEVGAYKFDSLSLGDTATYLGLDVYAQVFDSTDTKSLSTTGTGLVVIQSFAPAVMTPEGSSLELIAAGLLPLAWQVWRILKRKVATDHPHRA